MEINSIVGFFTLSIIIWYSHFINLIYEKFSENSINKFFVTLKEIRANQIITIAIFFGKIYKTSNTEIALIINDRIFLVAISLTIILY